MTYVVLLCLAFAPLAAQERAPAPSTLTLRELLDTVAATHPLVRAAASHTRAAQGSRVTAGALGNPVLGYQVDRAQSFAAIANSGNDREVMATATFPLEALYQRWSRVRGADATVRAAAADAELTRQQIALAAAAAYYRAALAQVEVATAHDLSAWLDTLVAYNRARVKEGATAGADLVRAELERDRAAADGTMQDVELARARAALAAFLGDPRRRPGIVVEMSARPLAQPNTTGGPPPASFSLDRRPDVRAARDRSDASRAALTTERTMIVRQLGATIGTQQMNGTTSLILGVSLPLPLFDSNRGEIGRASAERDVAMFDLAATERAASADVIGAEDAARLLTERMDLLASGGTGGLLARADEARRIALGAYREGAVPLLTVLDAARAWGEARSTFYRTLYAQHQSVLALLAAQGINLFANLPAPAASAAPNR